MPGKNDLEYQYFIKDHLGNTRTVLTTHPNTFAYAASMESENEEEEESYFAGHRRDTATGWSKCLQRQ